MNKQMLDAKFGYLRMVLGVTRRIVEQFPTEKFDFRSGEGARSVAEIVSHMYGQLPDTIATLVAGESKFSDDVPLKSKADALKYMADCEAKFWTDWANVTDAQLDKEITAWGEKFTGAQFANFMYDEHWHHRGQLTAYLRMLGIAPVMIYDYQP
ncbi:DinB family protein [candidate division KSB1 bacterium]|nr:DinB family protein [candidate division KSB1 bacterium]